MSGKILKCLEFLITSEETENVWKKGIYMKRMNVWKNNQMYVFFKNVSGN
jgi:capsule polysaccharide export protein KpsC/LpsZ